MKQVFYTSIMLVLSFLLGACGMNMYDQPKAEVFEASPYFENGTSVRPIIEGTVSRSRGLVDESFFTGQGLTELPFPVTMQVLERGQERYNIYCSPCHNFNGNGLGLIVQKGMVQPRSFHDPGVRPLPVSYFYSAITNGFGRMYPYASRIPPEDRWAIAGYIKALQLSQNASEADVPEAFRLNSDAIEANQ